MLSRKRAAASVPKHQRGEAAAFHLPIAAIQASNNNPRRKLTGIDELVASIRTYGLLQPVVVRDLGGRYELIAGHRRLAAVDRLGWATIPAVVRREDEQTAYLLTMVENLQRTDLTPREEAYGLEVLLRERGWTTRQVADAVNRSPAYVSKRLRVFEDPVLAPLVLTNQLPVSLAEELLPLARAAKASLARRAVAESWDNVQLRGVVRKRFASKQAPIQDEITGQVRDFRRLLQQVSGRALTPGERAELRRLFSDLTLMASPPTRPRQIVPSQAIALSAV